MNSPIALSLLPYNTFGLDVDCQQLSIVSERQLLIELCMKNYQTDTPLLILGGGSNVVLTESFAGHVVVIATKGIVVTEDPLHYYLAVEAGESWHELVKFSLANNMFGLENLALIPGSVGAAPIQNIGAYGADISMFCEWVEYLDLTTGKIVKLDVEACDFAYRESIFKSSLKDKAVILTVGLKLKKEWQPNIKYGPLKQFSSDVSAAEIFTVICETRMSKLPDPVILGNVGSFFKNPIVSSKQFHSLQSLYPNIVGYAVDDNQVKLAAGWLIDNAGLKGYQVGGAAVHLQQALVLVNRGQATGNDVCKLAIEIIKTIAKKFDITLEIEPRIIGKTGQREIANE